MLKALIKKQWEECFRSYFVNAKTGKARSKGRTAALFIFFGLVLLLLCGVSFVVSMALNFALYELPLDIQWLYFTLMGIGAVLLGVFGSVFNTYAALYLPKDNEALLSMPIPPGAILLSRLMLVYLLSLLYSGIVWLPSVLATVFTGHFTALSLVFGVLLTLIIALLVTVITCALGWGIALLTTRVRSKSFIVLILTVAFFVGYYYVCFNMSSLFEEILKNLPAIALGFKKWSGPLYTLGCAGLGDGAAMAQFTGITAAATAVLLVIMNRSYMPMLLHKPKEAAAKIGTKAARMHSPRTALLLRDLNRFTSSATYMMNAAFGVIMLPILVIVAWVNRAAMNEAFAEIAMVWRPFETLKPLFILLAVSMLTGMDCVTLPSVSLEGKTLWALQTLPVSGWQALRSKRDMHLLINVIPGAAAGVALCAVMDTAPVWYALTAAFVTVSVWLTADLGLVLGVKHPNLHWTNETVAIKQNLWMLVLMLVQLVILAATALGAWWLCDRIAPQWLAVIMTAVQIAVILPMEKWLRGKGGRLFETM